MSSIVLTTQTWGTGERSALLVHGITSDSGGWWRTGPALAEMGFTVVAPDLRGHGGSDPAPTYRLDDYAADVLALQESWDVAIGHSLGGATVLGAAAARPSFAGRLVLIDPWLINVGSAPPNRSEYRAIESASEIAAKNPRWAPGDVAAKAAALPKVDRHLIDATFAQEWDLMPVLAEVAVPSLLMAADPQLGALTTPAMGEGAVLANPNVVFETIRGAGHSIHRDSWDDFWALLGDFVGA